jgi:RimJ/RimL family protein N-acetyltransferase
VIAIPRSQREWEAMAAFVRHHAGVLPNADARCIGWVSDHKLVMAVTFQAFLGKTAQIHVAMVPGWHFTPRAMLREVFHYAFDTAKLEMLLGVVNSKNVRAMRWDMHLGFRELHRLPGMHDDGGDIVLLGMKKAECRYLALREEPVAAAGRA